MENSLIIPYNRKFLRGSNFRYFRERFEKREKYVSLKNCTLKESLEVGTGIFCCISCLIWNPDVNQGTIWCNYYTNNLYKLA